MFEQPMFSTFDSQHSFFSVQFLSAGVHVCACVCLFHCSIMFQPNFKYRADCSCK